MSAQAKVGGPTVSLPLADATDTGGATMDFYCNGSGSSDVTAARPGTKLLRAMMRGAQAVMLEAPAADHAPLPSASQPAALDTARSGCGSTQPELPLPIWLQHSAPQQATGGDGGCASCKAPFPDRAAPDLPFPPCSWSRVRVGSRGGWRPSHCDSSRRELSALQPAEAADGCRSSGSGSSRSPPEDISAAHGQSHGTHSGDGDSVPSLPLPVWKAKYDPEHSADGSWQPPVAYCHGTHSGNGDSFPSLPLPVWKAKFDPQHSSDSSWRPPVASCHPVTASQPLFPEVPPPPLPPSSQQPAPQLQSLRQLDGELAQ